MKSDRAPRSRKHGRTISDRHDTHAGISFEAPSARRRACLYLLFAHDKVSQGPHYETSPAEFSSGFCSITLSHLLTFLPSLFSFFLLVPGKLAYSLQAIKNNPITQFTPSFGRTWPLHVSTARDNVVKIWHHRSHPLTLHSSPFHLNSSSKSSPTSSTHAAPSYINLPRPPPSFPIPPYTSWLLRARSLK